MAKRYVEFRALAIIALAIVTAAGCGSIADGPGTAAGGTVSATTATRTSISTTPGDPCTLYGSWNTISPSWNGMSTASNITFTENGLFAVVPNYSGNYSFDGTNLTIWKTVGQNMTCSWESHWVVQLDAACTTATLLAQSDGCTGARRYLGWNLKLVRY